MNTKPSYGQSDENLGPLAQLRTIKATELDYRTPDEKSQDARSPSSVEPASNRQCNTAEWRLLRAIIDQPGMPSSSYPKLAGMSPRKAVEVRKQLVAQGLVRETELQTKARGRAAIVLTPTQAAAEVLHAHDTDQSQGGPTV